MLVRTLILLATAFAAGASAADSSGGIQYFKSAVVDAMQVSG